MTKHENPLPAKILPAEILAQAGWLRSLARQLVKDPNTADDVVQSTLVAALAWEGAPREGLRNWLTGVARNTARQIYRGERRRTVRQQKAAVPEALPSAGEMVELVESQRTLAAAVLKLEEPYRSTIFLRYYEELAPKVIAERLGIPSSTVRVRLKRGLELLRERLATKYEGQEKHWSLMLLPLVLPSKGEALAAAAPPAWLARGLLLCASLIGAGTLLWLSSDLSGDKQPLSGIEGQLPESTGDMEMAHVADSREPLTTESPSGAESERAKPLAEACCLVGRILNEEGEPLVGARVTAVGAHRRSPSILDLEPKPDWEGEARTDGEGIYRIPVENGRPFYVRAEHEGFAPTESLTVFAGEVQDLFLNTGQRLEFSIRETLTGDPLPGVLLRVQSRPPYGVPTAWSFETQTDDRGAGEFSNVPVGQFQLTASAEGYASRTVERTLEANPGSAQILRLAKGLEVTGIVLDAETREPVADALVEGPQSTTRTDHLGLFRLGGFDHQAPKAQAVLVLAPGYPPAAEYVRVEVSASTPHVEIRLGQAVLVTGRVVDTQGRPVAGAAVGHRGRFSPDPSRAIRHDGEVRTDASGRFEMALHFRAQYTLGALAPGFAMATTRIINRDPARLQRDVGDLVLSPAGSLAGVVQGREYDRLRPDTIHVDKLFKGGFQAGPSLLVQVVEVTPTGEFRVDGLAPGLYGLTLKGANPGGKRPTIDLVRKTQRVLAGDREGKIVLRPVSPITGHVTRADGTPGAGLRVTVSNSPTSAALAFTVSDGTGAFRLVPEGPGPFVIRARDLQLRDDPTLQADVPAGATDLELQLERRSTPFVISGTVTDTHGTPIDSVVLRIIRETSGDHVTRVIHPDAHGHFEIKNLDQEPYTLHAFDPEGVHEFTSLYGVTPDGGPVEVRMHRRE